MRIYEELFILRPETPEEEVDAYVAQITSLIEGAKGKVDKVDKWGIRRLAYRVEKKNEGYYVLIQFTAGPELVKEIERRMRVADVVMKFITVRIDEKLKKLEKRTKRREKRAKRRPAAPPAVPGAAPGAAIFGDVPAGPTPGAPIPGAPVPVAAAEPVAVPAAPAAEPAAAPVEEKE